MLLYRHSYLTLSLKIDFPVLICGVYKLGCREIVELEGNFLVFWLFVCFCFFPKKGFCGVFALPVISVYASA